MKRFLRFLLILLPAFGGAGGGLYAQKPASPTGRQGQAKIDSLLQELPKMKEDTNKVKLINNVSNMFSGINPDEGLKFGQQGLEIATKLGWKKGIATANNHIGINCQNKSDYTKAMAYYQKALKIYEDIGLSGGVASVTVNMGIVYNCQGDYLNALACYLKALKTFEEIGNKKNIANTLGCIGIIYMQQKDNAKALDCDLKALKVHEEIGDKNGAARVTGNIGIVYNGQGEFPKALEYYFKALKIHEEIGDKNGIARVTGNIGSAYAGQKNYTMAIEYELKAMKMAEELGDKIGVAWELQYLGTAYVLLVKDTLQVSSAVDIREPYKRKYLPAGEIPAGRAARLGKAINYLQQGLAICKELKATDVMITFYKYLAEAYKLSGDYKKALDAVDNYRAIKDSVFSKENNEKIVKLGMKNEYDRKRLADSLRNDEKEKITTLQLQRQRSYTYMGIAGILLLAGFSFFIVRERGKSERERKKSDDLLLNILPGEVAKELKANGTTTAKHYENVTVLFTDFVNFTNAGERMKPQDLIDELHTCFKAFDEITEKYKIEKIKTIGDAYLAVGGLPSADPKHAEHIVKVALEINAFMQDRLAKLGERTFEIRIGIHSGSVVAGIVGVKKFAYDIWGDTVNTAARMEQNSEAGKINISQTTYDLVKDKFTCEYRGEIDAKNKGMLKMYFVA